MVPTWSGLTARPQSTAATMRSTLIPPLPSAVTSATCATTEPKLSAEQYLKDWTPAVPYHEAQIRAAIEVAQCQFIAVETGLRAAELLFDVGGASTALRAHNFDRHWRNARTVANHNPRAYKAGVVGRFLLTGAEPPNSGFF